MKINTLIFVVMPLLCLVGCNEKATVEVSSVSLNTATIEMVEGETFSLVATVLPKDAEYDDVTWTSSNASVVSVDYGIVTAHKEGTATIIASAGGKSATCSVKVSAKTIAVTSISLDKTSLTMKVGETGTLTATVNPYNATDKNVTWTSSDKSVAKVEGGKVIGMSKGEATIKAETGGKVAECKVTVIPIIATGIEIVNVKTSMLIKETQALSYKLIPDKSEAENLIWSSSNHNVLTVDENGTCTAISEGVAVITIHNNDDSLSDSVEITVTDPYLKVDQAYKSKWGFECTVSGITVKIDGAKMTCTVSYTIKNITTDTKLSECTFSCKKKSGENASQYGFFSSLYPGESRTRSYTFDTFSSDPFIELKFENPFKNEILYPDVPDLVWDVTKYYNQ